MVSSRKLSRREFYANFLLLISAAPTRKIYEPISPKPRFNLGDHVISKRLCNDDRSPNYGGIDWEKGEIIGCCWNFPEWKITELKQRQTYFIRFDEANNPEYSAQPWIDLEHETNLTFA